jgi:hypothetical protein
MARGANITVENNFTRGLVTEFTAMNFPENAVTDTDNCVYNEFGEVSRRPGMDFEPGNVKISLGALAVHPNVFVEFEWFSVGNEGTVKFLVQQIGEHLRFFSASEQNSLSDGYVGSGVYIPTFRSPGVSDAEIASQEVSMTSGNGYLFVSHPLCDPFYVSYNQTTNSFTPRRITVQIRDIEGIDDGLATSTRPATLSNTHRYNLLNQGWYHRFSFSTGSSTINTGVILDSWRPNNAGANTGARNDFPSNADIWWLYKRTALQSDTPKGPEPGTEIFDSQLANQVSLGNTPAPKGYYIYTAWNVNRTAMTGLSGLPQETSGTARPSSIVFYAGRVWYAGTKANKYSSTLYFSQLAERDDQFGRCYQVNDPTSEATFDLIDTDGGTIRLPLAERVTGMGVINDFLLVLCSNCIYAIRGTDNGPFRATNYTIEYISAIGVPNYKSVVPIDGGFIWWAYDAIYSLSRDQIGIGFVVNNLSKPTIQSFIETVPFANRDFIKGAFSRKDQTVRWIFSDDPNLTGYRYNRVLELATAAQAFFPYTISRDLSPRIVGISCLAGQEQTFTEVQVTTTTLVDVTLTTEEPVFTREPTFIPSPEVFKFSVVDGTQFSFAEIFDVENVDWRSKNSIGVQYSSYGISGYRVRGEMLRSYNASPTTFVVENLDGASLLVAGIWDYGERQSNPHEVYLFRPGVGYQMRKLKLRGKGRSLQIRFDSVGRAPFKLVGWSNFETGGQMP